MWSTAFAIAVHILILVTLAETLVGLSPLQCWFTYNPFPENVGAMTPGKERRKGGREKRKKWVKSFWQNMMTIDFFWLACFLFPFQVTWLYPKRTVSFKCRPMHVHPRTYGSIKNNLWKEKRHIPWRTSRGLNWESKTYKLKRSIQGNYFQNTAYLHSV